MKETRRFSLMLNRDYRRLKGEPGNIDAWERFIKRSGRGEDVIYGINHIPDLVGPHLQFEGVICELSHYSRIPQELFEWMLERSDA